MSRRWAAALVLLAIVSASRPSFAIPVPLPRGDVNQDGRYDVADALALIRHLRGDAGAALTSGSKGFYAADVAPLDGSGAIASDNQVNTSDLLVLLRLIKGDLSPTVPTLNSLPSSNTNPFGSVAEPAISGNAPTGMTVHLFARNGAGTVVHIDTVVAANGTYSFATVAMLFEGPNEFFVVSVNANGFVSRPSPGQTKSWTSTINCSASETINATIVWTAHCGDYVIHTDLTVNANVKLILGPGVVLRFDPDKTLYVAGTLQANGGFGASAQRVRFTSPGPSPPTVWGGINVLPNRDAVLSRVEIVDAAVGIEAAGVVALQQSTLTAPAAGGDGVVLTGAAARGTLEFNHIIGAGRFAGGQTRGVRLLDAGSLLATGNRSRLTGNVISHFETCVESTNGAKHWIEKNWIRLCRTGIFAGSALMIEAGNRIEEHDTRGIFVAATNAVPACGTPPTQCWNDSYLPTVRGNIFRNQPSTPTNPHIQTENLTIGSSRSQFVALSADRNDWGASTPSGISAVIQDELDTGVKANLVVGFTPFYLADTTTLDHSSVIGNLTDQDFAVPPFARTGVGPLVAPENATSTVPAGITLSMPAGSSLGVNGDLIVAGTTAAPVTFRGTNAVPGHWAGITVIDTDDPGEGTDFNHLVVEDSTIAIDVEPHRSPTIRNSTLRKYSQIGVRFTGETNSEISNTLIDGTGIAAGEKALVGIHMKATPAPGSPTPTVTGNTITGNIWGLWLEGEGFAGTEVPNPVITGNSIYGNFGTPVTNFNGETYCWTTGANLCMSGYKDTIAASVNVTGNYWGTIDANQIRASIINAATRRVTSAAGASEGVHGANANFTGYLDAQGGSAVDSYTWSSSGITRVTQNRFVLKPVTSPTENSVTIGFTPAQDLVNVSVKIYRENDDGYATVIATLSCPSSANQGVPQSCIWDGRNAAGEIVPWDAYRYVVTGTPADGGPTIRFDPPRRVSALTGVAATSVFGDTGAGCLTDNPNSVPSPCAGDNQAFNEQVDLAKNQFFSFNYLVQKHTARPDAYPVRARIEVHETANGGPVVARPLRFPILPSFGNPPNVVSAMWDGRDDEGNLLTGAHLIRFEVPDPLRPNSVIVENQASRIDTVSADPYLVYHSYDQTTRLQFHLTATSEVDLHILPPGEVDLAAAVQTIHLEENGDDDLVPGTHYFNWTGQLLGGDSNGRSSVADGVYSFAIEAQHPSNPAHASIFRGVIQVRQ